MTSRSLAILFWASALSMPIPQYLISSPLSTFLAPLQGFCPIEVTAVSAGSALFTSTVAQEPLSKLRLKELAGAPPTGIPLCPEQEMVEDVEVENLFSRSALFTSTVAQEPLSKLRLKELAGAPPTGIPLCPEQEMVEDVEVENLFS